MKKTVEELKHLLHLYENDSSEVSGAGKAGRRAYEGLCLVAIQQRITVDTQKYIKDNVPYASRRYSGYAWSEYSKRGRVNWLKKHIVKLEG